MSEHRKLPPQGERFAGAGFAPRSAAGRALLRAHARELIVRARLRRGLPWAGALVAILSGATIALASSRIHAEQAGYSGPAAARCVPRTLNGSSLLPRTPLTVAPLPGSLDASPAAQISFLGAPARDLLDIRVTGNFSGAHSGRLASYSQGDGASFLPDKPFDSGETVQVQGSVKTAGRSRRFSFEFKIAYLDPIALAAPGPKRTLITGSYQSFKSDPELHPPTVDVTYAGGAGQQRGDIFAAPYSGPGNDGPMIFQPDGQLVWMDPLPENLFAANLQTGTLEGEHVLSWWQGYIPKNGFGLGEEVIANSAYEPILHVHAGNGYKVDLHTFSIMPGNRATFTVYSTIHCNLTADNGPRDGDVVDSLFQELDLATGLVRRQWTSVDHVALNDSYARAELATAELPFDYFHLNSVDVRNDGTTLLSARNTSQLYVIDDRTGMILLTAGGKHSSVTMGPNTEMAYQHDATTLANGEISVFDNGGTSVTGSGPGFVHPQTRGLVIELDARRRTDNEVMELTHPRPLQSGSQGNVQLLANGNWFMGWGSEPYFTEFNAAGKMLYDAHLPLDQIVSEHGEHLASYRGYKFQWSGTPSYPPAVSVESSGSQSDVYASWNGATEVARWVILGGNSPARLKPLGSAARSGFETRIAVPSVDYVEAQALDSAGAVIGHSPPIRG